jgi:hypothetical protein
MKTLLKVRPRERLSSHIHIRLTDSDYSEIQTLAHQVNLSMSDFMRRAALRRTMPHPLSVFDLKAYQVLCQINAQLKIAANNLNQMKKACNSALVLGEPVINRGLLENVQQLIRENQTAIKTIIANLTNSTVR